MLMMLTVCTKVSVWMGIKWAVETLILVMGYGIVFLTLVLVILMLGEQILITLKDFFKRLY